MWGVEQVGLRKRIEGLGESSRTGGVMVPPRNLLYCLKHNREKSGAPMPQLGLWDPVSLLTFFSRVGLILRQAAPHSARSQQQPQAASYRTANPTEREFFLIFP